MAWLLVVVSIFEVTDPDRPSGLPMASTVSPT